MEKYNIAVCILLAVITTNLIRVLPMILIKGNIRNTYIRSVLYYVPYVTLTVMTFPAIMYATSSPLAGGVALFAGIIAAWRGAGLFHVALISCIIVYIIEELGL